MNNGLQPALTAKEDTKASVPVQNAVDLLQDATPVASELSEAGELAISYAGLAHTCLCCYQAQLHSRWSYVHDSVA